VVPRGRVAGAGGIVARIGDGVGRRRRSVGERTPVRRFTVVRGGESGV
jgi:hypothetical protein